MTNEIPPIINDRLTTSLRLIGWTMVAGVLIAPAIAMQFTDEVNWTISDFIFAGVVLGSAGGFVELAVRASGSWTYRLGAGFAVLASMLLIWINAAVGIIGSEDHPANLLYLGLILIALVGAVASRFRAGGLCWTMASAAVLQGVIGALATFLGWGAGSENWPRPVIVLTLVFIFIWLVAAGLFRRAARLNGRANLGEEAAF